MKQLLLLLALLFILSCQKSPEEKTLELHDKLLKSVTDHTQALAVKKGFRVDSIGIISVDSLNDRKLFDLQKQEFRATYTEVVQDFKLQAEKLIQDKALGAYETPNMKVVYFNKKKALEEKLFDVFDTRKRYDEFKTQNLDTVIFKGYLVKSLLKTTGKDNLQHEDTGMLIVGPDFRVDKGINDFNFFDKL